MSTIGGSGCYSSKVTFASADGASAFGVRSASDDTPHLAGSIRL